MIKNKKNLSSKRDQYTVVLEDIRFHNKVFGEAQSVFRDQLDKVDKKLDSHTEILNSHTKILDSHTEMIGNIMIRLEEIKNEFKQKVDYQDFVRLEKRVVYLEAMGVNRH